MAWATTAVFHLIAFLCAGVHPAPTPSIAVAPASPPTHLFNSQPTAQWQSVSHERVEGRAGGSHSNAPRTRPVSISSAAAAAAASRYAPIVTPETRVLDQRLHQHEPRQAVSGRTTRATATTDTSTAAAAAATPPHPPTGTPNARVADHGDPEHTTVPVTVTTTTAVLCTKALEQCRHAGRCAECLAAVGAATVRTAPEMIEIMNAKNAKDIGELRTINHDMIATVLDHPACQPNATSPHLLSNALRSVVVNAECAGTFGVTTVECAVFVGACLASGDACRGCLAVLNGGASHGQAKSDEIERACIATGVASSQPSLIAEVSSNYFIPPHSTSHHPISSPGSC